MDHSITWYIIFGLASFFLTGGVGMLVGLLVGGLVALIGTVASGDDDFVIALPLFIWIFGVAGQILGIIGAIWAIVHILNLV